MRRRIWLLATILLATVSVAEAQQTGKIFRIGYLDLSTASGSAVRLEAFWQEIRRLGWIEGKNIAIEYRYAEGQIDRLPELAAELVRLPVAVLAATGGDPAAWVKTLVQRRISSPLPSRRYVPNGRSRAIVASAEARTSDARRLVNSPSLAFGKTWYNRSEAMIDRTSSPRNSRRSLETTLGAACSYT